MMPLYTRNSTERDYSLGDSVERGAVFPLLAIITFSILLCLGLAIDSGNLFTSYLDFQKAVDAGAVVGAKIAAVTSKKLYADDPTEFRKKVRDAAVSAVMTNFKWLDPTRTDVGSGEAGSPLFISEVAYDERDEIVTIRATWTIDLWFLKHFPGYGQFRVINYESHAQAQPAMVSLAVDTSGSMICPADGGNCSCAPVCPLPRKIDRLKLAVANFAVQFNSWRDMLHIGFFSLGATTAVEMRNFEEMKALGKPTIDFANELLPTLDFGMPLQGATNQCDGLIRSYLDTLTVRNALGRQNIAFVLLSDGAPTAARFFFANPKLGILPENSLAETGGGADPSTAYDYYSWASSFRHPADLVDCNLPTTQPLLQGVQVLARSGRVPYDWNLGSAPGQPPPPGAGATCQGAPAPLGDSTVPCSVRNYGDADAAFAGCLNDFSFYAPRLPAVSGSEAPGALIYGAGRPFSEYRKQYYDCVIAMSDFLRNTNGIVYTIGLGAPAPNSSTDPYQVADNDALRKDIFFRRLAFTPKGDLDAAKFPGLLSTYVPPAGRPAHLARGEYLGLDNATGLEEAFQELYTTIVRKIKTVELVHR